MVLGLPVRRVRSRRRKKVAEAINEAMVYAPRERLVPCTNRSMAPMRREIALAKLRALGQGAMLARTRLTT
jgi:5-methyltetrahydropteroyltriglutamate--homocysteine methyltransferase